MSESPRPLGREIVLAAFVEARDRTLTNAELGDLRGVQAFHQRISNLKDRGYVFTPGVHIGRGRYAYRLLGYAEGTPAASDPHTTLPWIAADAVEQAIAEGTQALKDNPPAAPSPVAPPTITPPVGLLRERDELRANVAEVEARAERAETEVANAKATLADARTTDDPSRDPTDWTLHYFAATAAADIRSAREALARLLNEGDEHHIEIDPAATTLEQIIAIVDDVLSEHRAQAEKRQRPRRSGGGSDRLTGPALMVRELEAEGKPMHSKVIAERVMSNGGAELYQGKTPAATMAAQLATSNVKGGEFVKVSPGVFGLRSWDAAKLGQDPIR
jgi:hypothetical protein